VAWALLVPPFQVPDEGGHFAYAQSLAEGQGTPGRGAVDFSTEHEWARSLSLATRSEADPELKPAWDPSSEREWERLDARLTDENRKDVGSLGAQVVHPPLYYAYEAVPYAAASGGDLFDRLHLMRLWSGLLMLVTTAGAWLLIGELTGRDRLLQLAGAACVGLQPMATFLSAGVNADAGLFAAFSIAFWLGARVLLRGPGRWSMAGLLAATAAAALVKPAGMALLPAVALALGVAARRRGVGARAVVAGGVAGAAVVALTVVAQRGLGERAPIGPVLGDLPGLGSYLWQFYLPKLPSQSSFEGMGDLPLWHVWHETSWAAFGNLEVRFPDLAYAGLAAVAAVVAAGACAAVLRGAFRVDRAVLAFFGVAAAALVGGLHWAEFNSLLEGRGGTNQGRYLLPLIPIAGCAVAAGLTNLRLARRPAAAGLVMAGMVALQIFSLAVVAGRFYA
jgi:hypothetical protein